MLINWIKIHGAKSFRAPARIELRGATLLYGANSSGKSTIIQTLILLKQSLANTSGDLEDNPLEFRGPWADLGGYRTFVSNHDMNRRISIQLGLSGPDLSGAVLRYFPGLHSLGFTFSLIQRNEIRRVEITKVEIGLQNGHLKFTRDESGEMRLGDPRSSALLVESFADQARRAVARTKGAKEFDDNDLRWLRTWLRKHTCAMDGWVPYWHPQSSLRVGEPGRPAGGSQDSARYEVLTNFVYLWQEFAWSLAFDLREAFRSVVYVGPLRDFPKRLSTEASDATHGVGVSGQGLVRYLASRPDVVDSVNEAFEIMEIPYQLNVDEPESKTMAETIGEVAIAALTDKMTGLVVSPADVGFGVSQVLPVIVQAYGNSHSLIVIEQPEIHLHPKLQSRLMDVLMRAMEQQSNRFLIETHSEHLLLRAQRRVRSESGFTSKDLFVHYVAKSDLGSKVIDISLNDAGEMIDPWPDGFFDERFEDLFASL